MICSIYIAVVSSIIIPHALIDVPIILPLLYNSEYLNCCVVKSNRLFRHSVGYKSIHAIPYIPVNIDQSVLIYY